MIGQFLTKYRVKSVLDIACGEGSLIINSHYQPKIIGIDKKQLKNKPPGYSAILQLDVEKDDLNGLSKAKFEAIVLADVLEHLNDPTKVLDKLKSLLADKGFLIVSVPNMDFWLVKFLLALKIRPKMSRGLFDKAHKHDFNLQKMNKLLNLYGFKVIKTHFTPVPLPILSPLFDKKRLLYPIYKYNYQITNIFPKHFAYQVILVAKK